MKWVWPLSWYFRIRELERQLVAERAMNHKLEMSLRAANIQNTMLVSTYSAAVTSMAASVLKRS